MADPQEGKSTCPFKNTIYNNTSIAKIKTMEKSLAELAEQQSKVESSIREQKEAVQEMPKFSKDLRSSADKLKQFVLSRDKDERDMNLILHNIPESVSENGEVRKKYDVDSFCNVAAALLGGTTGIKVQQVMRQGKKEQAGPADNSRPRTRLMLIKVQNEDIIDDLIRRRTQLKDVGFTNVCLTRDVSREESVEHKAMRDDLVERGRDSQVLFRGKIMPRKR